MQRTNRMIITYGGRLKIAKSEARVTRRERRESYEGRAASEGVTSAEATREAVDLFRTFFDNSVIVCMTNGKGYAGLITWQKAMDLVDAAYELVRPFPKAEMYSLTAQIKRAAVSIPSNIAEGHGRRSKGDFLRSLDIARGSLCELETQILMSIRRQFTNETAAAPTLKLLDEVARLIVGLSKGVSKSRPQARRTASQDT